MKQPTHAIYFSNNWDGEGDLMWLWGFLKDGVWYNLDTNEPIYQFDGDKILKVVAL